MLTPQQSVIPLVRKFQRADAAAIARLAGQSPEAAQWSERSFERLLEEGYAAWVAVAGDAGEIIGFLIVREIPPDAEILNLAVAPRKRRTGTGRALLEAGLSELLDHRVQRVFLEVRASNWPAVSFYTRHLFQRTSVRPAYYQHPAEDAVLMERTL
jgi:ribosomal-protein-alanine N-acetyltransferase